ncbi:hypothetical protein [Actinoallomurus soli]|uniref:hypothetical protein n=1 Tax=Actinoallomurus soli TaxID=2952535 RepID=UPI0020937FFA|nr:hypothetical protein [Actinoallomurus soli]MCO5968168.1 hypothetical protein [Actinoallomurus soli]
MIGGIVVYLASAQFVPASVTVMPDHGDLVRMVPPFAPVPGQTRPVRLRFPMTP